MLLLIYMKYSKGSNMHRSVRNSVFQLTGFEFFIFKKVYCRAPPLTAPTGITSTAWHPWRPARSLFWATLLLACEYPALTQRIICSKIKRRETQALGYVKLLSSTDNGNQHWLEGEI